MSSGLALPPSIVLAAPSGTATLPLVELELADVIASRKQLRLRKGSKKRSAANCSFGDFSGHLAVEAWPLFHAAKKTELTTTFTASDIDRRALCFAAEFAELFVWNAGNLRRVDRSIFALEDFSEAGLAGRFGEAVAYLTMQKLGYIYFDRIAVLWERAAAHGGMTHPERVKQAQIVADKVGRKRPDKEPDFAFEHASGDVALMESKGSFVHPINDDPTTKKDLRHALNQIAAWTGMITPMPSKSYAIGTYFRDQSDSTGDPSLITLVDPPGEALDGIRPVEFPPDWIRRGNYGAWLLGMGFSGSGNALRLARDYARQEREVPTTTLNGQRFAFTIDGIRLKTAGKPRFPWPFWEEFHFLGEMIYRDPLLLRHFLRDVGVAAIRIIGIESPTLRLVEESLDDSKSQSLMRREPGTSQALTEARGKSADGFSGSVLPDGTIFGEITLEQLADVATETYRL